MKAISLLLSLAATAALLAGCGGGDKQVATGEAATPPPAAAGTASTARAPDAARPAASQEASAPASASARVIQLTGNDTMRYNITEITATPGEALRVELKNIGRMPKQTMSHNFILLKPMSQADITKLATEAATKPPQYLPADQSNIIVHTKMLGPGETDAVEFKAPTEPGTYPYVCTFPGHFALMKGNLIVK